MARKLLFLLLALTSCSKGPEADLQYISEARSLAAEWALVNEQAAQGHLTAAYAQTMRASIRDQLQSSAKSLTQPRAPYAAEIGAILSAPDDAPPATLRGHASNLKRIEDQLESD
jgi:Tfp pilus assembly protein PilP